MVRPLRCGLPVVLLLLPIHPVCGEAPQNGDPLPTGALARVSLNSGPVSVLVRSPDGKIVATGGNDELIYLWDANGKEIRILEGHERSIDTIAFSPDGRILASGGGDKTIRLWDPATGRKRRQLIGHQGRIHAVAFAPDGRTLASASHDQTVRLWDVAMGKELRQLEPHRGAVDAVAFAPDGQSLATGSRDRTVRLWATDSGKLRGQYRHHGWVHSLAFSPDGRWLASGARDQSIRVWNRDPETELRSLGGFEGAILALAFSADGRTLAAAGLDKTISLWELVVEKPRGRFTGHTGDVCTLQFTANEKTLISGCVDGTVITWDVTGQKGKEPSGNLASAELEARWSDLASSDGFVAYRAIWTLSAAPGPTVGFIKAHLRPIATAEIEQLIADLDSNQFLQREKARAELAALGKLAEKPLRKALAARPSLEVRRSIERLNELIAEQDMPPHLLRALRAIELLERIGTPAARELLQALAQGAPDLATTQEARIALDRLAKRIIVTP